MPAKNKVKQYLQEGYYHIYNRGVEKRDIFLDEQDYGVFLNRLKRYLSRGKPCETGLNPAPSLIRNKNFYGRIKLLAYCLMPNHFHLLLQQKEEKDMSEFITSLCASYSMYFNKKYQRSGSLFQGTYKAILVENDPYLLHLSRYIHLNPFEFDVLDTKAKNKHKGFNPAGYSSYACYLGKRKEEWVDPEPILHFFKSPRCLIENKPDFVSYQSFVEHYPRDFKQDYSDFCLD